MILSNDKIYKTQRMHVKAFPILKGTSKDNNFNILSPERQLERLDNQIQLNT